jgi:hypothetical protein
MISSTLSNERANRSHQIRGADVSSARIASACFIRVAKRDQLLVARLSFPPQTPLRQRELEAALRRSALFIINQKSPEA